MNIKKVEKQVVGIDIGKDSFYARMFAKLNK